MSTLEHSRLLTVQEVADHLGVSRSTVRRRIRLGEIPAVKVGSEPQAAVRIDPVELHAWLYGAPSSQPATAPGGTASSRRPSRPTRGAV